jgi:hypothetical protein
MITKAIRLPCQSVAAGLRRSSVPEFHHLIELGCLTEVQF